MAQGPMNTAQGSDRGRPRTKVSEVWGLSPEVADELEQASGATAVAEATAMLLQHLKSDRIAVVVRRPASKLGGQSLLEVGLSGAGKLLDAVKAMFDWSSAGPV